MPNPNRFKWKQTYRPPPLRRQGLVDTEGDITMKEDLRQRLTSKNKEPLPLNDAIPESNLNNNQRHRVNAPYISSHKRTYDQRTRGKGNNNTLQSNVWYKMIIPYGDKMGKSYLINTLQQKIKPSPQAFIPIHPHISNNAFIFWINNVDVYRQLLALSLRMTNPDGYKIKILGVKDKAPDPPQLDEEYVLRLKNVMSMRYDPIKKILNLSDFANDSSLKETGTHLPLFRANVIKEVLIVIEANIPDVENIDLSSNKIASLYPFAPLVDKSKLSTLSLANNMIKSECELLKLSGLIQLKHLALMGNPLIKYYKDTDAYISAIRKIFPNLETLDGQELPLLIKADLGQQTELPPTQPSFFANAELQKVIETFLQQYYLLYDNSDHRLQLASAYDDNAYLSISTGSSPTAFLSKKNLDLKPYISQSHNLERIRDPEKRLSLIHQGSHKIVSVLNLLPPTQHDFSSFTVDVIFFTTTLLVFSVTGLFQENNPTSGNTGGLIRYFSRIMFAIPFGQGIKIINDMWHIMAPTLSMVKGFNTVKKDTSSHTIKAELSITNNSNSSQDPHDQLVNTLSSVTGMKPNWAKKCLIDNAWNYEGALATFNKYRAEGLLPSNAFI